MVEKAQLRSGPDSGAFKYARKVVRLNRGHFVETDPDDMREECLNLLRTELHVKGLRIKDIDVTFTDRDPDHPSHTDDAVWALVEAMVV